MGGIGLRRMYWICHQLGSREHYAIPRALQQQGALALLQTDAWVRPSRAPLLQSLGLRSLALRYHQALKGADVRSHTVWRVAYDIGAKGRRLDSWTTIIHRNEGFQSRCLSRLRGAIREVHRKGQEAIVFSYSYTARRLFEEAKKHGARCVLGQIDPGPAEYRWLREKLPDEALAKLPEPPVRYWNHWQEEIAMADAIVVNSAWSLELLSTLPAFPSERAEILPLAFEPKEGRVSRVYPDAFSKERPLQVLFLGQLIPRKGIRELIEAAAALSQEPVVFTLAGPGRVAVPDGLLHEGKVVQYGPVDRETALRLYRSSDVFLLPTHSDGFGLTQLEAAAAGLPLIVSRHCGQVVEHDRQGIVLATVSVAAIVDAVRRCLREPELLRRFAGCPFDWERFSLQRLGECLQELGKSLGGAVPGNG